MIKAILRYQEIDKKMYKLEKELASCDERKEYVKLKKYMASAEEKLDSLEARATALKGEANELNERYTLTAETLKEFEHMDELVEGGADISFYKKKAQTIVEHLKKLRADIKAVEKSVEETSAEYQELKSKVIACQKKRAQAREKYQAVLDSRADEKQAIEKELAVAGKEVDAELLENYKKKRMEKVEFPIVGQLSGELCPGCFMEISLVNRNALSNSSTIECEHCRRIIYR